MSVTVSPRAGGGVIDGELRLYYACPKCGDVVRFMALFESLEICQLALENIEVTSYGFSVQRVGRFIVGTVAGKAHGQRSVYTYTRGSECSMVPFYGTDRELLREIWARFQQGYGEIDWSKIDSMPRLKGSLDCTRLAGVEKVENQMEPDSCPLLMVPAELLRDPVGEIVEGWDYGNESYEKWTKRREGARAEFLAIISSTALNT